MPRPRALITLALTSLLAFTLAACNDDAAANLPDGSQLVSQSATAMRDVTSAHIAIDATGQVGALPIKSADGDLTKAGDAKGTIKLSALGALIEMEFVVVNDTFWLKGITGGWQQASPDEASRYFDPSGILDPERGIAKIIQTATEAKTVSAGSANGADTYDVQVKLDNTVVSAVLPGVPAGVTGTLSIDRTSKLLVKAVLKIPAPSGEPGTVTIDLTDLNKPVTISAPQ